MAAAKRIKLEPLNEEQRKQIAEGLREDFGIEVTRWDENTGEPILDYEQSQTLVNALCDDIAEDSGEIIYRDQEEARCKAALSLRDGRRYDRSGFCLIGEKLGDAETVSTTQQAVAIAQGRAYRAVLRAINFNPIRAYRQWKATGHVDASTPEASGEGSTQRKRLHALAQELGYIKPGDRSRYVQLLQFHFGADVTTSVKLNEQQLSYLVGLLQADANLQKQFKKAA